MNTTVAFFVITIVAIVFGSRLARDYLATRRKELESGGTAAEYQAQIDELEERIQVLERIVTEQKFDLKREISQL